MSAARTLYGRVDALIAPARGCAGCGAGWMGRSIVDVQQLLGLLDRLVDGGKPAIVIAHHQAVMAHADWIIDLGPGAGHDGGRVVFEGTRAELVAGRGTVTGVHLAAYVGG